MKGRIVSKFCSLFVISTLFFILSCSHTPKPSVVEVSVDKEEISPDFIVPPLDRKLIDSSTTVNKNEYIWNHIAENLTLSEFYSHPRVEKQKEKYLNKPEYLAIVSQRAETFIHFVLSEIERRNLPAELAVLPIVESSYFPKARSRAKAVGLWQFMPYTAKEYGLKRTYGYDGRHDVYASTIAALNYLEQLNNKFEGNWLLALAAYNAGPQRITRALKKNSNENNENIYWNLKLPRETNDYIPKILALSSIINDHNLSDTLLHPIEDESFIEPIAIEKRISPRKLVEASGISAIELRKLNPALRHLNNPVPDGYHLLVPKHQAQLVSMTINSMPEESLQNLEKHLIKNGESLSGIARQYGTSIAAIQEANNLAGHKIVAGRTLSIPPYSKKSKSVSATTVQPINKQVSTRKSKQNNGPYIYVVAMGDSFWKIASRNNTTVDRLAIINGRSPNQPLRQGESILID